MGQLIDASHPLFRNFPTEFYSSWQWWPMAVQRAVILPERMKAMIKKPAKKMSAVPKSRMKAVVTEMDSYAFLRPMAKLFECRCGNGKLLFSTMNLQNLQQYPEARALLDAIYRYLSSEEFAPEQEMEMETLETLVW